MKLLVGTTGNFQLVNGTDLIRAVGYTVISPSPFVHARASIGQLQTIADLNDEATDAEWLKYVDECGDDLDLAVASFKDAYAVDRKEEPVAKKTKKSN